jgi:hypothetical protein
LWRFLQFFLLQQVSHFLFLDHFQIYIPWCHEKLNGKPLFSKIDKMKICWGGPLGESVYSDWGSRGSMWVRGLTSSLLRDGWDDEVVPSSIDADVAVWYRCDGSCTP